MRPDERENGFRSVKSIVMPNPQRRSKSSSSVEPAAPRVWIVDDNSDIRDSLSLLLRAESFAVRVFSSAEAFFRAMDSTQPQCVLLDYGLPDSNGLDIQAQLQQKRLRPPIVFLSGNADVRVAVEAMRHGAIDFIEKPCSNERLLAAITAAVRFARAEQGHRATAARYLRATRSLTPREREVLEAIGTGARNKHVAASLCISPRTVESHRESIMRKFYVRTTADMMQIYFVTKHVNGAQGQNLSALA